MQRIQSKTGLQSKAVPLAKSVGATVMPVPQQSGQTMPEWAGMNCPKVSHHRFNRLPATQPDSAALGWFCAKRLCLPVGVTAHVPACMVRKHACWSIIVWKKQSRTWACSAFATVTANLLRWDQSQNISNTILLALHALQQWSGFLKEEYFLLYFVCGLLPMQAPASKSFPVRLDEQMKAKNVFSHNLNFQIEY